MQDLAPIVLFTFNRYEHTVKTLEALKKNILFSKSKLFIYSDGPRNKDDIDSIIRVRDYSDKFKEENRETSIEIKKSDINKGLASSIITGVTEVINAHGKVIVLEDDLVTSPLFLNFMNQALQFYEHIEEVGSVTGYNPISEMPDDYNEEVYFSPRNSSLGWGTWKNIWMSIDWEVTSYNSFKTNFFKRAKFNQTGLDRAVRLDQQLKKNIQSWSIRFGYNLFTQNKLTVYPSKNFLIHIGWDGSGTHTSHSDIKLNMTITADNKKTEYRFLNKIKTNRQLLNLQKKLYGKSLRLFVRELYYIIRNYGIK